MVARGAGVEAHRAMPPCEGLSLTRRGPSSWPVEPVEGRGLTTISLVTRAPRVHSRTVDAMDFAPVSEASWESL